MHTRYQEQKNELSDDELLEKAGLKGEEYGGLKKSFYEKSTVIVALRRMLKKCNNKEET